MAETKTNIPFQVKMGAEKDSSGASKLPSFEQGSLIITTDTKKVYVDPIGSEERIAVGGTEVVVDSELSKTSENPVQNKVVTNAMVGKKIENGGEVFNDYVSNEATGGYSHAEGSGTIASVAYSHAEGNDSKAVSLGAHAEGQKTLASGDYSHAEGWRSTAAGIYAHAEGSDTTASGAYSHSQNKSTKAGYEAQTAMGKFNNNKETTLLEVGNGTSNPTRSNAFEVYKDGHAEVQTQGSTDNSVVIKSELDKKQDKIGTLTTHEFESGGIARILKLGGHSGEDYLYIRDGSLVVDQFRVPTGVDNSFSVGPQATFDNNVIINENMKVGKSLIVSNIKSSDSGSAELDLGSGYVSISRANALSFSGGGSIYNVDNIGGNGNSLWVFSGSLGGSSFISINNGKKHVKIGDFNSGQQPIPLLGVSTPISVADTSKGITADDLDYQAVNKKYVDDAISTQVSSVYKAKGSVIFSELPTTLTSTEEGYVYNVSNEFTTTDLFIEGAGKKFPSGTNIVVIKNGDTYKYDVLAGMVDLSDYATKTELSEKQDNLKLQAVTSSTEGTTISPKDTSSPVNLKDLATIEAYNLSTKARLSIGGSFLGYNNTITLAQIADDKLSIESGSGAARISIATPTDDYDAATKKYVDDIVGDINTILATLVDVTSTQSDDEQTSDETVSNDETNTSDEPTI